MLNNREWNNKRSLVLFLAEWSFHWICSGLATWRNRISESANRRTQPVPRRMVAHSQRMRKFNLRMLQCQFAQSCDQSRPFDSSLWLRQHQLALSLSLSPRRAQSVGQEYFMQVPETLRKGGLKARILGHKILKRGLLFSQSEEPQKWYEFDDMMLQIIFGKSIAFEVPRIFQ